jgi:hypothetical protein
MADKKLSEYADKIPELTDKLPILDLSGVPLNKKALISAIKTLIQQNVQLDTTALPSYIAGQIAYDPDTKSVTVDTGITDVRNTVGQESYYLVYNDSGAQIDNGKAVYASGVDATTELITIDLAQADSFLTSVAFIGLATHDIPDASVGIVTNFGVVRDWDTSGLSTTGILYLSDSVAGGLTNTKPSAPSEAIIAGKLLKSDASTGKAHIDINRLTRNLVTKSYTFTSNGISAGTYYIAGYYDAPAADANLSQASTTQTHGSASASYAAHAFIVPAGVGTVDAGTVSIRVTGTSITDAGVRTGADSETIEADITTLSANTYYETSKKWLGTVMFELVPSGATTYSLDFNYGFSKYEDAQNRDYTIGGIEVVGLAGANDSSFDIELLKHTSTGWTYSATAFVPGNGSIATMKGDHSPDDQTVNGENFAWKRTSLNEFIDGNGSEGAVIRVTTGANNTVQTMDVHLGVFVEEF